MVSCIIRRPCQAIFRSRYSLSHLLATGEEALLKGLAGGGVELVEGGGDNSRVAGGVVFPVDTGGGECRTAAGGGVLGGLLVWNYFQSGNSE